MCTAFLLVTHGVNSSGFSYVAIDAAHPTKHRAPLQEQITSSGVDLYLLRNAVLILYRLGDFWLTKKLLIQKELFYLYVILIKDIYTSC
jgi:hypothetical protein